MAISVRHISYCKLNLILRVFDKNGDGHIDSKELREAMLGLGEKMTQAECDEMIHEADTNNDGTIDYKEFVKMISSK